MSDQAFKWIESNHAPAELVPGPGFDPSTHEKALTLTRKKWETILDRIQQMTDDPDEGITILTGADDTCGLCGAYQCPSCPVKIVTGTTCGRVPEYGAWADCMSANNTRAVLDVVRRIERAFLRAAKSLDTAALLAREALSSGTITIEVRGGNLEDVTGLPPHWDYTLIDWDVCSTCGMQDPDCPDCKERNQ